MIRREIPAEEISAFKHRLVHCNDVLSILRVKYTKDRMVIVCEGDLIVVRHPKDPVTVELIGDPNDTDPIRSAVQPRISTRQAARPPRASWYSKRHRPASDWRSPVAILGRGLIDLGDQ